MLQLILPLLQQLPSGQSAVLSNWVLHVLQCNLQCFMLGQSCVLEAAAGYTLAQGDRYMGAIPVGLPLVPYAGLPDIKGHVSNTGLLWHCGQWHCNHIRWFSSSGARQAGPSLRLLQQQLAICHSLRHCMHACKEVASCAAVQGQAGSQDCRIAI